MWTLRRGHRHFNPDTLAEYMDGRLGAAAWTRVDEQLASCTICRNELEELQATVALLQQLPVEPLPRSFTLPVPPVQQTSPRPSAPSRMPQWVYASAASAAAVVLAVLVSADATGLLEPGPPQVAREIAVGAEMAAAFPDQATPIQNEAQVPAVNGEVDEGVSMASAAPVAPEAATAAPEAAVDQVMSTPMPAVGSERDDELAKAPPLTADSSVPVPPGSDLPTAKPKSGSAPVVEPGGTATVWRVVEGVAAALGLVFLGGMLLRRRSQRGVRLD